MQALYNPILGMLFGSLLDLKTVSVANHGTSGAGVALHPSSALQHGQLELTEFCALQCIAQDLNHIDSS